MKVPTVCSEPLSARSPSTNTHDQFYPEGLKAVEKLSPSLLCTVTARPALTQQGAEGSTQSKTWLQHKSWRDLTKPATWNYYLTLLRLATEQRKQGSLQQTAKIEKNAVVALTGAWGAAMSEKCCKPQIRCSGSWLTSLWLCQHSTATARLLSSFSFLKAVKTLLTFQNFPKCQGNQNWLWLFKSARSKSWLAN